MAERDQHCLISDMELQPDDVVGQPLSFLVIEDDLVHRMVIGKVAESAGFKATAVATIDEATKTLEARTFDCISLDLSLARESGARLLKCILKYNSAALVIIISGASEAVRAETLWLAGDLRLNVIELPKPVDLAMLRENLTNGAAVRRRR